MKKLQLSNTENNMYRLRNDLNISKSIIDNYEEFFHIRLDPKQDSEFFLEDIKKHIILKSFRNVNMQPSNNNTNIGNTENTGNTGNTNIVNNNTTTTTTTNNNTTTSTSTKQNINNNLPSLQSLKDLYQFKNKSKNNQNKANKDSTENLPEQSPNNPNNTNNDTNNNLYSNNLSHSKNNYYYEELINIFNYKNMYEEISAMKNLDFQKIQHLLINKSKNRCYSEEDSLILTKLLNKIEKKFKKVTFRHSHELKIIEERSRERQINKNKEKKNEEKQ